MNYIIFIFLILFSFKGIAMPIQFEVNGYAGQYFIKNSTNYISGDSTQDLQPGNYELHIGSQDFLNFSIANDGTLSSSSNSINIEPSKISFKNVTINIDSSLYSGQWYMDKVMPTFTTGSKSNLVLVPYLKYSIAVAHSGIFFIKPTETSIDVLNLTSASSSGLNLTFNTVNVDIDNNGYTGQWRIARATPDSYTTGGLNGVNLIPGVNYTIVFGQIGINTFQLLNDGTVSSNTSIQSTNGNLTFKTRPIKINANGFAGQWLISRGPLLSYSIGNYNDLVLVEGVKYKILVGNFANVDFQLQSNGTVNSFNTTAMTGLVDELLFNVVNIDIDHNLSSYFSIVRIFENVTADSSNVKILPGLTYQSINNLGEIKSFSVSNPCAISPNQLNFSNGYLDINCHQSNNPPEIFITSPLNQSNISGNYQLRINISDENLNEFNCKINNEYLIQPQNSSVREFSVNSFDYPDGTYSLSCFATDNFGLSSSYTISININNSQLRSQQVQYKSDMLYNSLISKGFVKPGSEQIVKDTINKSFNLWLNHTLGFQSGGSGSGGGGCSGFLSFCGGFGDFDIAGAIINLFEAGHINLQGLFEYIDVIIDIVRIVANPADVGAWIKLVNDVTTVLDRVGIISDQDAAKIHNGISSLNRLTNFSNINNFITEAQELGADLLNIANGSYPLSNAIVDLFKDVGKNFLTDFLGPFKPLQIYQQAKSILKSELNLKNITKGEYKSILKNIKRGMKDYLKGNLKGAEKKFNLALNRVLKIDSLSQNGSSIIQDLNNVLGTVKLGLEFIIR